MKNLFLTVFTVVLLSGMLNAQTTVSAKTDLASSTTFSPANTAVCKWEKTSYDFGSVPQGKPVSVTFNFTNSGSVPLIISSVHPSCGCTTEDYTKDVIAPGKKGYVKLTYNASAMGVFTKTTTVSTNADPSSFTLTFNGNVVAATNEVK